MASDALFEQLKHPNPNLRNRAMLEIADNRDENTIPKLISALDEEDIVYRRAAVQALGVIGTDVVVPLIDLLLNSDNSTVRASCAKVMAQVAVNHSEATFPSEGIEALRKSTNDLNPVVHIASVMALGEIGEPAFDVLVGILKTTENVTVAVAIVNALGDSGNPQAVEILKDLSQDTSVDPYVQESAVSALPRLDGVINYKNINWKQ
jgi:bilin biosynthesis protein